MPVCECCGAKFKAIGAVPCAACQCMVDLLCRACNHCLKHCVCAGVAVVDLPYPEQLMLARHEWAAMGVRV